MVSQQDRIDRSLKRLGFQLAKGRGRPSGRRGCPKIGRPLFLEGRFQERLSIGGSSSDGAEAAGASRETSMSNKDPKSSRGAATLLLTAMVIGMALMENSGNPRPAPTSDNPPQRQ